MKKVKAILVSLVFIISEIFYRTVRGLKVVNPIDDGKNTTPMSALKDQFLKSKFISGLKFIQVANDRSGNKKFAIYSIWNRNFYNASGKMIFLPIVNPNQSIRAAMLAPKDKDGRVDLGNSIRTKGAITTWITIPPLQLSDLIPLIAAVNDAHTEAEMHSAWFALNKKLRKIMQLVQDCMDENVDESANIAAMYGFTLWGKGGPHQQIFEGFTGSVTGTVDMLAEVGPTGCAYAWFSWNAARTVRTYLKTSTYAHCTIADQVSHVPLNISVDTIEGEEPIHESQIVEVIPK